MGRQWSIRPGMDEHRPLRKCVLHGNEGLLHVVHPGEVGRLWFSRHGLEEGSHESRAVAYEVMVEVDHAGEQVLEQGESWKIPDGLHLSQ